MFDILMLYHLPFPFKFVTQESPSGGEIARLSIWNNPKCCNYAIHFLLTCVRGVVLSVSFSDILRLPNEEAKTLPQLGRSWKLYWKIRLK